VSHSAQAPAPLSEIALVIKPTVLGVDVAGLEIRELTKSFGKLTVLDEISFIVEEGEFCILLGPSGCGKTTLLRIIAGLEQQDRGQVRIGEREVSGLTPKERDVSMVFQSYALYPHMSIYQNLAFPLKAKKTPKAEIERKVRDAAQLLGIDELLGRKPKELSGGQRQRAAIGRAIVRNPEMFLFDEPLSNLDAKLRANMRVELAKLHQTLQATMVYVTHDQIEAMTLGQKIVLLHQGKIQQVGTPRELYNTPANLFVATFIGSPTMNVIEGTLEATGERAVFRSRGVKLDLDASGPLRDYAGAAVTLGIRPEALSPGREDLRARLEVVEHVGSETILYLNATAARLVAKAPPDWEGRVEDDIPLAVNRRGVHLFAQGKRIPAELM
jgi:ABC-type sugar transport system ATPase subunit